jgi:hypothetical protein
MKIEIDDKLLEKIISSSDDEVQQARMLVESMLDSKAKRLFAYSIAVMIKRLESLIEFSNKLNVIETKLLERSANNLSDKELLDFYTRLNNEYREQLSMLISVLDMAKDEINA